MKKLFILFILQLFCLLILAQNSHDPSYGYFPDNLPEEPSDNDFLSFSFIDKLYGYSDFNYNNKDFTHISKEFLSRQVFNTQTVWPAIEKLPSFFTPDQWINNAKNPGLDIVKLHDLNIKGQGLSIAIIDKPINPNHDEFDGRITYIEVFNVPKNEIRHFHGIACASILAGNSCGILPEAHLYYFAVPDDGNNSLNYIVAFEKLFEINDSLPAQKRIMAVSISDAIDIRIPEVAEKWPIILNEAKKRDILIIYSDINSTHKYFTWGGCPPDKNPNIPNNFRISPLIIKDTSFYIGKILIPADYRTTAQNHNCKSYTYWGNGGFSWAIPYLAGVITLGKSINSALSEEDLYRILIKTKYNTPNNWDCINPVGFIKEVVSKREPED